MRARAIQVTVPGGPEVLSMTDVEVGDPGPGEVRIVQRVLGLNFIDTYHRTGIYPLPLPFIPGIEGVGVVDVTGEGVTGLAQGDRVAYAGVIGAYATARIISADRLVRVPDDISDEVAAAVLLKGMTAFAFLEQVYPVARGDTILVHAAAGGLGLVLCQWAAAIGATVIGTVSSEAKAELAYEHGCAHPIIYTREDFVERVSEITKDQMLPVVYDSVGKDTFLRSLECLRPRGMMVLCGQSSGVVPPFDPGSLARGGSLYLTRPFLPHYISTRVELMTAAAAVFERILTRKLKVSINQQYSLEELGNAHRHLEARRTSGSSIITV